MNVYEYVIIYQPEDEKSKPEIIQAITSVFAKDEKTAGILAARAIPEKFIDKLDEVEVVVRPF